MKVVVSGFYGFGNTGDEAIALALTRELSARGHQVTLLSQTPAQSAALYGVQATARMSPVGLLQALRASDVLLSGGGGLLQDKTSKRSMQYYLAVITMARLLGKRTVVFNQSIGPLSEDGGKSVARALSSSRVIVRDEQSRAALAHLGVMADLGGDPALLLQAGVQRRDPNTVVLAPRGDVSDATERLSTLCAELKASGKRVVALSFYPQEDDRAAHALGADEVLSTTEPQVALDAIAASGYVVGVRLHALILAAAAHTPFTGLSYDPKVSGFCADAGALSVPTDVSADVLRQAVNQSRAPNWENVAQMQQRARESFDWALGQS